MKEYGDVQHEIMHALGFYHEVSRSDRDDHVFINFQNIAESEQDFSFIVLERNTEAKEIGTGG